MSITLPLTVKIIYEKEAKSAPYVAYCPELDISSCGPTEEKARKNLEEAIDIVLRGAAEDGTLKDLLLEAGFEIEKHKVKPPKTIIFPFHFILPTGLEKKLWLA